MTSSPSLCPLFHDCRLTHEFPGGRDESHETSDNHGRRVYGNLNMPLNISSLPLNPDHIATQMRQHPRPLNVSSSASSAPSLRRSPRATRRSSAVTRIRTHTPTPRPLFTPTPQDNFCRGGAIAGSDDAHDTRRHGMFLEDPEGPVPTEFDTLPSYSLFPSPLFRRATVDGTITCDSDPMSDHRERQTELRELQRQWNVRRRTHPMCPTERTVFRSLVSEAFDLPPPYAPRDPYPLFKPVERKPSIWSRVVLYPFVPEGEMLNKAAFATDRMAKTVVVGVKKGVEEVGKKAKAVPRQIESTRAMRKIRWLEGKGYVDGRTQTSYACGTYPGAYHVVDM